MSTRTKIILRIAVTLVVLGLVVLGVWLIWFKPTNELEIFQNLTSLQNESQKNFISARDDKDNGVKSRNYLMSNTETETYTLSKYENTVSANYPVYGQIAFYRAYMFGNFGSTEGLNPYMKHAAEYQNNIETTLNFKNNQGLTKTYEKIDEAFKYYYSYVQLAEDVEKDDVKEMNRLISNLKNDYNGFASLQQNELANLYKNVNESNKVTILNEVCAVYEKLYIKYFDVVDSYNKLTLKLQDFVVEYVFDGVVTYDIKTVKYDVFLNTVAEWTAAARNNNSNGVAQYKVFVKDTDGRTVFNDNKEYIVRSSDVISVLTASVSDSIVSKYANIGDRYAVGLKGNKSIFKLTNKQKNEFVTQYYANSVAPENKTYSDLQSQYDTENYLTDLQEIVKVFFRVSGYTSPDNIIEVGGEV